MLTLPKEVTRLPKRLLKIAVTGGLSCGKSSVCHFFKELGAYVVSADEVVHQLLSPSTVLGQEVIKLLGPDIVVNFQIDRSLVAKKVFQEPRLLKSLEQILHPAVAVELEKHYKQACSENKASLFVAEIPLLFEARGRQFFDYDYSVAVVADEEICRNRFQKATSLHEEAYQARADRQMNVQEKADKADYVIVNNGTLQQLRESVINLYRNHFGLT